MPMSEASGNSSTVRVQPERTQRVKPAHTVESDLTARPEGLSQLPKDLLSSDFSQGTFERHAALLGDPRMSHSMYSSQRSAIAMQLQRDYGNRYVQRLVNRISQKRAQAVQTKLTVGPAGDKYEQEADRVAKQVMGSISSSSSETAQRQDEEEEQQMKPLIQRQEEEEDLQMKPLVQRQEEEEELQMKPIIQRQEEEEELRTKPVLQRQVGLEGGDLDPSAERTINRSGGGGQHLPANLRRSMEGAFGADFSGVKVHTGADSDALNDSLSSRAFTTGRNIFFREGDYTPGSSSGKELIAHELTHVVQQNGPGVKPTRRQATADPAKGGHDSLTVDPRRSVNGNPSDTQRMVMTDKQWIESSSRKGRPRSKLLLEIDGALTEYNASQSEPPGERLKRLLDLADTTTAWRRSKEDESGDIKSRRADSVEKLRDRILDEMITLAGVTDAVTDPKTPLEVRVAVNDLYNRGVHKLHAFLAKAPTDTNVDEVEGDWQSFRTEAMQIEKKATTFDITGDNLANNVLVSATALREAMRAFRTIAYLHLGSERKDSEKTKLPKIDYRLAELMTDLKDTPEKEEAEFLGMVMDEIDQFAKLAGAGDQADEDELETIREDEGVDFELLEEMLGALDTSTTMLGFQGTGGKGNEGFNDLYTTAPKSGDDKRSDTAKALETAFSGLTPGSAQGNDIVSGVSDMENSVGGLESDGIALLQALKAYKDPKSTDEERLQAKLQMAQTPFSTVSNVLKFAGGAMTTHRGGDSSKLAKSNLGFDAKDTNVSTDVKMFGDFSALFAGIISTIAKGIDLIKYIKDGGGDDPKSQKRTTRKDLEAAGNGMRKYTGAVASLAGNFKAAAKLGYQIAGDGQKAATEASSVANLGGLVPGLQLAFGVMEALQHGYKLVRIGVRRMELTKKIDELIGKGGEGDLNQVEAVEFAHGALVKRTVRLGINLGHALAAIVAGGFNLSGVGLAVGMVISISSGAMRVGQLAARHGKQALRNRKGGKRAEKDESRGGSESYKEWEHRKRLGAAQTGKFRQFRTAMDIKFTFNWDKTSENKESTNRDVALEILRMEDTDIYDALGVTDALQAAADLGERLKIVLGALKKRD